MLMSLHHQHLYPSPTPATAVPSNRIHMKMKPPLCVGFERVNRVCEIKPVYYLVSVKICCEKGGYKTGIFGVKVSVSVSKRLKIIPVLVRIRQATIT